MPDSAENEFPPGAGRVWLRSDNPRDAGARLRVPVRRGAERGGQAAAAAVVRLAPQALARARRSADRQGGGELLGRFPELVAEPEVLAWLSDSDRWRAVVSVVTTRARARSCCGRSPATRPTSWTGRSSSPRTAWSSRSSPERRQLPASSTGVQLDDLARACGVSRGGREPAPAELTPGDRRRRRARAHALHGLGPRSPRSDFRRLPEAHLVTATAASSTATPPGASRCRPTRRSRRSSPGSSRSHPGVRVDDRVDELIDELVAEHDRASATVALSYAEDAELDGLELGGELHPFQRAGVRYALERRRTFIADEQGLGKTVQALATLEADDAFPAVVVCPASMKLTWERESRHLAARPQRRGARRPHRRGLDRRGASTPRSWSSTTTSSSAHCGAARRARAARARPRRVALREEPACARARRPRSSSPSALPARRAAAGADRHADPQPARGARVAAAGARPAAASSAAARA